MPCTTLLVGKDASYDGSTLVARNEDCGAGQINEKKFGVILPQDQPSLYTSTESHLTIDLSDLKPLAYTHTPDAVDRWGVFSEAGVNELNVAMSATETTTTNARVLGADPFVEYQPAKGAPGDPNFKEECPGGIGEEDFVTLVLPYISTPREGVIRLGRLLEQYGTYESNGIAFSDANEIWWMETIGGHHWMARRVPDNACVVMPNQFGIDYFDFEDAAGEQREFMCSDDLLEFVYANHLDLTMDGTVINPRAAFGSHTDQDHIYNTPRAWDMLRNLCPSAPYNEGKGIYGPESDCLPWSCVPESKVTIEDIKYILGSHFQGTPYDPYGNGQEAGKYRPIGVNRTAELSILQLRGYMPKHLQAIQWLAFGCNTFNCLVPLYTHIETSPEYVSNTTRRVTTESMYWTNRIIGALCDNHFNKTRSAISSYQLKMAALAHKSIKETDETLAQVADSDAKRLLEAANQAVCDQIQVATDELLGSVLFVAYDNMKNAFAMND